MNDSKSLSPFLLGLHLINGSGSIPFDAVVSLGSEIFEETNLIGEGPCPCLELWYLWLRKLSNIEPDSRHCTIDQKSVKEMAGNNIERSNCCEGVSYWSDTRASSWWAMEDASLERAEENKSILRFARERRDRCCCCRGVVT
ncbi:unnamed protein product [Arabis nemorensis]|uniref:Uncharacterized protein n=1 Tax=Arabis nemorensis TaxID=586526 RepID=A0A565CV73_9BRAS|nr:unnamed protein product [Arabis nemorensis]